MANGKTAQMTVGEVKSVCNSLEISPSCHTSTSPVQHGKAHTVKQPKHPEGGKTHAGSRAHTKEMPTKFSPAHSKRGH
jgi:hypothetical protein